jgi:hypothetical protein
MVFFLVAAHALAINNDEGGLIDSYIHKYRVVARSKEPVTIAGECASACTLVLGLVPKKQVCFRPGTTFAFHRAFYRWNGLKLDSKLWTRRMFLDYTPHVRRWIVAHGGLTKNLLIMRGEESGLRMCGWGE